MAWQSVSEQRKQVVLTDIAEGSSPKSTYYILEGLSASDRQFWLAGEQLLR
jgi:hypothetical protein